MAVDGTQPCAKVPAIATATLKRSRGFLFSSVTPANCGRSNGVSVNSSSNGDGTAVAQTESPIPSTTEYRIVDAHWLSVKDGDPRASSLFKKHYSYHKYADGRRERPGYRNRHLIVGPGEKMVLLTLECNALFVWRKFIDDSGQQGVNCAIFRNESDTLSSELILEAEQLAWGKWPGERLYTYVDGRAVKGDGNCFKKAGWKKLKKRTGSGKIVLAKLPEEPA